MNEWEKEQQRDVTPNWSQTCSWDEVCCKTNNMFYKNWHGNEKTNVKPSLLSSFFNKVKDCTRRIFVELPKEMFDGFIMLFEKKKDNSHRIAYLEFELFYIKQRNESLERANKMLIEINDRHTETILAWRRLEVDIKDEQKELKKKAAKKRPSVNKKRKK